MTNPCSIYCCRTRDGLLPPRSKFIKIDHSTWVEVEVEKSTYICATSTDIILLQLQCQLQLQCPLWNHQCPFSFSIYTHFYAFLAPPTATKSQKIHRNQGTAVGVDDHEKGAHVLGGDTYQDRRKSSDQTIHSYMAQLVDINKWCPTWMFISIVILWYDMVDWWLMLDRLCYDPSSVIFAWVCSNMFRAHQMTSPRGMEQSKRCNRRRLDHLIMFF
jgi:hypothetical protein